MIRRGLSIRICTEYSFVLGRIFLMIFLMTQLKSLRKRFLKSIELKRVICVVPTSCSAEKAIDNRLGLV